MEQNIIVSDPSASIRTLGRKALEGNWGLAIGGVLLYSLLAIVPIIILTEIFGPSGYNQDVYYGMPSDYIDYGVIMQELSNSLIGNIYSLLVTGPLMLGLIIFIGSIFRSGSARISELFSGFEHFGKALGLYIVMNLFIFFWSLLLIIPGIIAAYRYSMAFYILMDHPEIGIMDAIRASKEMMRNNKWKLFCLHLSFIGWAILAVIPFGLGFIVLSPYIQTSIFAFYELAAGNLRIRHESRPIPGMAGPGGDAETYKSSSFSDGASFNDAPFNGAPSNGEGEEKKDANDLADMIRKNLNNKQ